MKSFYILIACLISFLKGFSQLVIGQESQWVNTGAITVTLDDIDMVNEGIFLPGSSIMRFSGNADNIISGNAGINFYDIEMTKNNNNKISLFSNINVNRRITFASGLLDLNQRTITLAPTAFLNNENENSRIIGPLGGEIIITQQVNAPNSMNPGNLGAIISSSADLGEVTIKRGHKTQTGSGLNGSIHRYFDILSTGNTNANAILRFTYFENELNLQNENTMILQRTIDNGSNWIPEQVSARNGVADYVEKTTNNLFSKWTLSSSGIVPLPVLFLDFSARRISKDNVQLNWKTAQEINNLGYHIERRKENEPHFNDVGFINSMALGGNSNHLLQYSKSDTNSFNGKTYYRIKQQDIDGNFAYSVIRVVNNEVNKTIMLKVWPIPANNFINIGIDGIEKATIQVFDMNGKIVKQTGITNGKIEQIKNLPSGTYIVSLVEQRDVSQKIIIRK